MFKPLAPFPLARLLGAPLLAILLSAAPAGAQSDHSRPGMSGHGMEGGAAAPGASMMQSMDKMSHDMAAVPMTGDADRDFVAMMIPHHQGAIDMAQYELDHGKDPALLKLAREIVAAQKKEIAAMRAWQARHPAH